MKNRKYDCEFSQNNQILALCLDLKTECISIHYIFLPLRLTQLKGLMKIKTYF